MSKSKYTNRLNQEQFVRLVQWVQTDAEKMMSERPNYTEGARLAEKELGFGVGPKSFHNAAKLSGVQWEPKGTVNMGWPSGIRLEIKSISEATTKLTAGLAEAEARLDRYEDALTWLREELARRAANGKSIVERLNDQAAAMSVLRGLIHHLYLQLGATPPNGYVIPVQTNKNTPALKEPPRD